MQRGFSLVELSIVLVILGLLTGGILAGQSLIRASELRAVTSEYQRYSAAVHTFRDKYFAIPGDMSNATAFWGVQHATPATCRTTASTSALTCNGDGDGRLVDIAGSIEYLRFWQQLANAGLIEGTYTGALTAPASPSSKLGSGVWSILYVGLSGDADTYVIEYGNFFQIHGPTGGPVLKPEEAWNIDTKLDDGKPASGKVIARFWNNLCAAADDGTHANNDLAASYKLSDTATRCSLHFVRQF